MLLETLWNILAMAGTAFHNSNFLMKQEKLQVFSMLANTSLNLLIL